MGVQRVLALFVLCTIFGASIWSSAASSTPTQLSLTAAAVSGGASFKNVGEGQCPSGSATRAYNPSAPKHPRQYCGVPSGDTPVAGRHEANLAGAAIALACIPPKRPITNLYGKTCTFTEGQLAVTGECIRAGWCKGKSYKDQQGKDCPLSDPPKPCSPVDTAKLDELKKAMGEAAAANDLDRFNEIEEAYRALKYPGETQEINELRRQQAEAEAIGDEARVAEIEEKIEGIERKMAVTGENTKIAELKADSLKDRVYIGGEDNGKLAPVYTPSRPSPSQQIEGIADTPPSGGEQGWNPSAQSTFNPSPILNNIANWGGIPSGGGSPPFSGSPGGYAPSGGNIAYVPIQQYGSLTSPNFDRPTAINFPEARPSPEEILENLAQNTKRQPGEKVTEGELRGGRVVDNVVLRALDNFFTPAGEFIRAFFAQAPIGEVSNMNAGTKEQEDKEGKSPLERGRLVLTLAADDSLVPGDPSSIGLAPTNHSYEAFESIPESNLAWVQSAPRAREGIAEIESAPPTYGWGGVSGDAPTSVAPEVDEKEFDPIAMRGNEAHSSGAEKETEEPQTFFSVLAKSFGAIAIAVKDLFRKIGAAVFWWL